MRKLMREMLAQIGIDKPRKGTIDKLASLGLDAATEAAGIVLAKLDGAERAGCPVGGVPPTGHPVRSKGGRIGGKRKVGAR